MALTDDLLRDMQAAMRAGDVRRRETLRMVRAAIKNEEVAQGRPLDDAGIIEVLQREAKKRREPLEMYRKAGRQDLVEQMETELSVIAHYLPSPLSEEELEAVVREAIAEAGATDPRQFGQVMKLVMPRVQGRADGRLVSEVVRRLLTQPS
ncbi:MAG: GatB/YqeY domain-containing protein [Anaerolineae bacterium]|jgi:uncharacterized protein YqeY